MQPHQEQRADQQREILLQETGRAEAHDADLEQLHVADDARLFVFVRKLAGGRGKQEKRQDEKPRAQVHERARTQGGQRRRVEREHDDERVLVNVVVERAEKLGAEKRQEAPFAQQPELIAVGHYGIARNGMPVLYAQFSSVQTYGAVTRAA